MKNFLLRLGSLALLAGFAGTASAAVFTNDAAISVANTNYDGQDIVVSNATLTVDGPHTFAGIRVAAGGVLTHSAYANGLIELTSSVVDEPQVLVGTNAVPLAVSNVVPSSVVVRDMAGLVTYTNAVDYALSGPIDGVTTLQRTETSAIGDGALVLVSYDHWSGTTGAGLNLDVSGGVLVDSGGAIRADRSGYASGIGPGSGASAGNPLAGGGGGFGGLGGMSSSNALGGLSYGLFDQPANLGSSGGSSYVGPGGRGGGAVRIVAGGPVTINGILSANGGTATNSRAGGGSGGGIWITASSLDGSGSITANGGSGEVPHGGGGGGGRIAIECGSDSFLGSMTAYGGLGAKAGGAGTVFKKIAAQNGLLVVDNAGRAGTNTVLNVTNGADVLIQGKARVVPSGAWEVGSLSISSNGLFTGTTTIQVNLTATGDITIQAGGSLEADSTGYGSGVGTGTGRGFNDNVNRPCGGAGHGGYGGNGSVSNAFGGNVAGSLTSPSLPGSGGGALSPYSIGGTGGGVVQLTVAGVLTVDGRISANGGNGSGTGGGGGAGGSVWVTVATISGSGSITAHGGNGVGSIGGGGGGGRIAIYPDTNLFSGQIAAFGGSGAVWGGAGKVLIQPTGQNSQIIVDNGGHSGTNTPVSSVGNTELTVRNGAVGASTTTTLSLASLFVGSNSWLTTSTIGSAAYTVTVSGNATIQSGGGIVVDLKGYPGGSGNGMGGYTYSSGPPYTYPCGGAGHGGFGGAGIVTNANGGNVYDNLSSPTMAGSGGGYYPPYSFGGAGGGALRLTVNGTLELDGSLSANGGNGSGTGGGGGSGGSIYVTAGNFLGSGSLSANGGNGVASVGGGGGGGMMAIVCNTSAFGGSRSAFGGSGANRGGAGTISEQVLNRPRRIVADNGGPSGARTVLSQIPQASDLTIRGGAIAGVPQQTYLTSLLVGSNSWITGLTSHSSSSLLMNIISNATFEAGGGVLLEGTGSPAGSGSGSGRSSSVSPSYPCSGAGHGGYGANSAGNYAQGGTSYGSAISPRFVGSGGGNFANYSFGGPGGGALELVVNRTLQLNGTISVNGASGSGAGGGGGSGGSVLINAGTLTGSGSISANGGNGAALIGGGGGGGRIALLCTSNSFAGTLSAAGGSGANRGGAGTIYTRVLAGGQMGQLTLDNGGFSGTNTFLQSDPGTRLVLRNGAAALVQGNLSLADLVIGSNSWLNVRSPTSMHLTVSQNLAIQAGGGIVVDGAGYPAGQGMGAGQSGYFNGVTYVCGGAGHAGWGAGNAIPSYGDPYDSLTQPVLPGSGGGYYNTPTNGGSGGGAIRFTVTGTLQNDGRITANGGDGTGQGGGGAGGSIWLTAGTFAGGGFIAANGGNGADALGGGGGGGRISIQYNSSSYSGTLSAIGGGGRGRGGAGTIYTKANNQSIGTLIVDNGGQYGAQTPADSATRFDLTVGGGAVVYPANGYLFLNTLHVDRLGCLTGFEGQTNLDVAVLGDAIIATDGALGVDGLGFLLAAGPGAGLSGGGYGSGAGYGGEGGASAATWGGPTYGSALYPVDQGSGGGAGSGPIYPGTSQGGGAIRLTVGGTLTVNGWLSANGSPGVQDNSGGGSGGSIWVTAASIAGNGLITADGGPGELLGGGGGGGGRIALYRHTSAHRTNNFTGIASAYGAEGDWWGDDGSVLFASDSNRLRVLSHTPSGVVSNGVSYVDLDFSTALNLDSFSTTNVSLDTPMGAVLATSVSPIGVSRWRVNFPLQTAPGDYSILVGAEIKDLYGDPMTSAYTGTFAISLPVIAGTITDLNGQPVAGVTLVADAGLAGATTDANGNYALGFVPGFNFTVTPTSTNFLFAPPSMSYVGPTQSVSNQNYIAVESLAAELTAQAQDTNLVVGWYGLSGVNYQIMASTNLIEWVPFNLPYTGSNAPMEIPLPVEGYPQMYFRVQSGY